MTDKLISIGKISRTFGLKGDLKVSCSGTVLDDLKKPATLTIYQNDVSRSLTLSRAKKSGASANYNEYTVKFDGYDNPEDAASLKGLLLYLPEQFLPATASDEFYIRDLIDFRPEFKGEIIENFLLKDILPNPAHPILLFSDGDREILVPFIHQFVGEVDSAKSTIDILNWDEWLEV